MRISTSAILTAATAVALSCVFGSACGTSNNGSLGGDDDEQEMGGSTKGSASGAKGGSDKSDGAGGSKDAKGGAKATGGKEAAGGSKVSDSSGNAGGSEAKGGAKAAGGTKAAGGGSATGSGGKQGGSGGTSGGKDGGNGGKATGETGGSVSEGGAGAKGGSSPGAGGTQGGGGDPVPSECGLPDGPESGVAEPSGAGSSLEVVPWAGYTGAVTISLDDGTQSQIANADKLKGMGIPLTFYLVSSWANTSNDLYKQATKAGHEIGNHTQSHSCGTASAGQTDLEKTFGTEVYTLAAPNGDTACGSQAQSLSLLMNRGVNDGTIAFDADDSSIPWNLPTYLPNESSNVSSSTSELTGKMDGAASKKSWQTFCIHGFQGDTGGAYHPIPIDALTAAVKAVKAKNNTWFGTMRDVVSYWRAARAFAKASPTTSGSDKTWTWTLPKGYPPGKCLRVKSAGGVVKQDGAKVPWNSHGYYEISLDKKSVTLSSQ